MKLRFLQLESGAFLSDYDFIKMTAEERGVYITLILYLNCNNGKLTFNKNELSFLCNCSDFVKIWQKIKHKFITKHSKISHKRVNHELKLAKKRSQTSMIKGLKGAQQRWGTPQNKKCPSYKSENARAVAKAVANENVNENEKRNENENEKKSSSNSNTKKALYTVTNTVRSRPLMFNTQLCKIIEPRNQSDRTCFRNVTNWLIDGVVAGRFNDKIFDRVLDFAKEAKAGMKPAAVFMALMKKELNYAKNKYAQR